ncbi:hypothetical protein VN1338_12970 [Helicobacter pylori]
MDHALRDALVVEVGDLLAQVVVLQEGRAAFTGREGVVGVAQPGALGGGEVGAALGPISLGAARSTHRGEGGHGSLVGRRRQRLAGLRRLLDGRCARARRAGTGMSSWGLLEVLMDLSSGTKGALRLPLRLPRYAPLRQRT